MHSKYWVMTQSNDIRWVRLGEYIVPRNERNSDLRYGPELIEGVNSNGEFQSTKASTDGINMKPYKAVWPGDFVYNPSRLNIGSLSYRQAGMCIVSHLYVVFHIKEEKKSELIPEFLWMFFKRNEFLRMVDYFNYGSQRAEFNIHDISEFYIPLPSPEKQRELVATWKGLRDMKEQNEAMAAPLMQLCQSRLQELKHTYPLTEIGPYIEQCDERNSENLYTQDDVRGISTDKKFLPTKANLEGVSLTSYKVVNPMDFAYVADTSRRGDKIALALNTTDDKILISSIYTTFKSKDLSKLLSEYLYLMMSRSEFDRYARFHSWGSARETFNWEDMCRVAIPLPSIEEQQAIVNIYKCAAECKRIAEEADKLSREICPALMQKAIRG